MNQDPKTAHAKATSATGADRELRLTIGSSEDLCSANRRMGTLLSADDLQRWLRAVTTQPRGPDGLMLWINGPLKEFFPFASVFLGHGEHVAGQIQITHFVAHGYEDRYLQQIAGTFDLAIRGSFKWWLINRQPFCIDRDHPPPFATAFELDEIRDFGLGRIACHGIINAKSNVGTYFSFAGIPDALTEWHLDALTLIAPVLNELFLDHLAAQQEGAPIDLSALTSRQVEIVRGLGKGLSDKAIARELGIAEKTVRNQLTEVYNQLGVRKRAQLIALLR